MICNFGTKAAEGKGKTELLKDIFHLDIKNSSHNQFHKFCINLYVTAEKIAIVDISGGFNLNESLPWFINNLVSHSCLVILSIDQQ